MSASPKKILLVDGDREFVAAHELLLRDAGYAVSAAHDGRSALEQARRERPDLVILDIIMGSPEEGFELCRALRNDQTLRDVKILVLTAVGQRFQMAFEPDGLWLPADRLLEKPVEPDALLAEVGQMLGGKNHRAPSDGAAAP